VNGATYLTPTLEALPAVTRMRTRPGSRRPDNVARLQAARSSCPWGARYNYGISSSTRCPAWPCSPSADFSSGFPALAPRSPTWQRELLDLLLAPDEPVQELEDPLVRIDDLLFCSTMDHFLHQPNAPVDRVRERILGRFRLLRSSAAAASTCPGARKRSGGWSTRPNWRARCETAGS
jgi:capsular polysaccharide biosynthesis protein